MGEPTGLSLNVRTDEAHSIDGALGFNFAGEDSIYLHSTYLWQQRKSLKIDSDFILGWYGGVGARAMFYDNNFDGDHSFRFGPRGALGLNYEFNKAPVEIFAELSLSMDIIPSTDADLGGSVGVRYYF